MASFLEKRKETLGNGHKLPQVPPTFKEKYPLLSEMLNGVPSETKPGEISTFRLSLFPSDQGLRFSLVCFESGETWFGSAGANKDVLMGIEQALERCDVEMKREKKLPRGTL